MRGADLTRFVERVVLKKKQSEDPRAFEQASPLHQVSAAAPPFCVVHGTHDTLISIADARAFAARLRETSRAPVFASHSTCRALSNIPRNLTDDQIRAIAAKGGVVMVNISSMFVDQKVVDAFVAKRAALMPQFAEAAEKYKDDPKKRDAEVSKMLQAIQLPRASWKTVVDHIERVLRVGGPGSAGLGTDFDGIEDPPEGLEDVSKLPVITEELLRRGHSEGEVRGVLGENFLRFWDRANLSRAGVPARKGPMPMAKP